MATEASQPLKVSRPTSVDLAAVTNNGQYTFVKIAATTSATHFAKGQLVQAVAGDHNILGILQNKPTAAGQMGEVVVIGVSKVIASGAITAGATLGPDAVGKAQAVTVTGSTYTKSAVGVLLQDGDAAANDVVQVVVNCLQPLAGT